MENKIFREKSMEQLSAPEQLTGYLKVTGPGVWFVLIGLIVLLAGMLIWGTFGRIISTVTVPVKVSGGAASCYVLSKDLAPAPGTVEVEIGDVTMEADTSIGARKILNADDDPMLYVSGYLSPGKEVKVLLCETDLADGFYSAQITIETLRPISLLFSKN